ncbi:MAG TPA: hypothetical protein VFK94_00305, partial [Patescibacteria group bacterium]|nr:hypothetical protein [Patescibacteria group bacterium]
MNKVAEADLEKKPEVETPAPKTVKKSKKSDRKTQPSKRFQALLKDLESKLYPMDEAIEVVLKNANAKFDETVEIHFRLG